MRGLAIPIVEGIKQLSEEYPVETEYDLGPSSGPMAHGISEIAGIVGVTAFVGSWAATKALDEIYNLKLSPLIKSKYKEYSDKAKTKKKYALTIAMINQEKDICLLIACIGRTPEEIDIAESHVESVLDYVRSKDLDAKKKEVLLVVLEGEKLNLEIDAFPNYSEAINSLKHMYPAKIPKANKNTNNS